MNKNLFSNKEYQNIKNKIDSIEDTDCIKQSIDYIFQSNNNLSSVEQKFLRLLQDEFYILLERLYHFKYKDYSKAELIELATNLIVHGYGPFAIIDISKDDIIDELKTGFTDTDVSYIIKNFLLERIMRI